MITDIGAFIDDRFDECHRLAGKDLTAQEVRDALLPLVAAELASMPRDLDAEALRWIAYRVDHTRDRRRADLKKNLDWYSQVIESPEDAIGVDAVLDMAYPLGRSDGSSKTLRLWTVEDLRIASMARYRQAAEQMASAAEFDDITQQLIDRMHAAGASTLGALA